MSRLTDAILGKQAYGRYGEGTVMLDLAHGGQHGYSTNPEEWISNQAYVQQHLTFIVLETPRFFEKMPESQKWIQTCKSIFEQHATSITGYNAALSADFEEHAFGGAGEMQQEVTNVTRVRSEPVFELIEKAGRPIQNFLEIWMTYGMMDPESKYALMGTLSNVPEDALADWFTMSGIAFETDPLNRKVNKAWITTNMMPKGTGDITGKRDLRTAKEILTLSVEMTGISQYGAGPRAFAQSLLDKMNRTNANPTLRPAFINKITSDLEAANISGYREGLDKLAKDAIKLF